MLEERGEGVESSLSARDREFTEESLEIVCGAEDPLETGFVCAH